MSDTQKHKQNLLSQDESARLLSPEPVMSRPFTDAEQRELYRLAFNPRIELPFCRGAALTLSGTDRSDLLCGECAVCVWLGVLREIDYRIEQVCLDGHLGELREASTLTSLKVAVERIERHLAGVRAA